jgi:hypothetical protein
MMNKLWWKNLFRKTWLMMKRLLLPAIIIFTFWLLIFAINIGYNKYHENSQMNKLKVEIDKLTEEIISLNDKSEIIESEIIINSIMKLQPKLDKEIAIKISAEIIDNCMEKELSPYLIICLIFVESGFNQLATSNKKAVGLMQIHWDSWKGSDICKNITSMYDLYQIDLNIDCGTSILKKMIIEGGGIREGLNSYYGVESKKYHEKMANALYKIMFNN